MADENQNDVTANTQQFLDRIPHIKALGVKLVGFSGSRVTVCLPYQEHLVGNLDSGVIAGGAISAVLDNVCGSAVVFFAKGMQSFATLDLRIDYMKPATPHEDVFAYAECYKMTRQIAFVRGAAYQDSEGNPVANAAATFMFTGTETLNKKSQFGA